VATRIKTAPVRVKLYTEEYVITGLAHTKPGGYRDRVSDLLNDSSIRFLALTDCTFRPANDPSASAKRCSALIVRVEDIKLLIPFEDTPDGAPSGDPGELSNW